MFRELPPEQVQMMAQQDPQQYQAYMQAKQKHDEQQMLQRRQQQIAGGRAFNKKVGQEVPPQGANAQLGARLAGDAPPMAGNQPEDPGMLMNIIKALMAQQGGM